MNTTLKDGWRQQGPEHPDWDERRCGFKKRDGAHCIAFRRRYVDGSLDERCRAHGGGNQKQIAIAISRTAGSSYILRREVAAKFRAFNNLSDRLDLSDEIDLFRSYLAAALEKWQEKGELELEEVEWVMTAIEKLARLVETVVRIRNTTALTIADIVYLQAGIAKLFKTYVPPEQHRRALEELFALTQTEPGTEMKKYYDTVEDGEVVHHPDSTLAPRARHILRMVDDSGND